MTARITRGAIIGTTAVMALALTAPVASASGHASSNRTTVEQAPAWTAHAARTGSVPASQRLHLNALLALRDEAGAEALAKAVSDPGSAQYGKYVSAASWRSRFAPRASDVAMVTSWLRSQGFSIGAIPANHRYIPFSGTSAQVEKAFGTRLAKFAKHGTTVSAPTTGVSVPSSLSPVVMGIGGLDTSTRQQPLHVGGPETKAARQGVTAARSAAPATVLPPPDPVFRNAKPCSTYYGQKKADVPQVLAHPLSYAPCGYKPPQLRGAYGINPAVSSGYDGRGATVAIVDAFASPYILKDAQRYAMRNDPSHPLRASQFAQNLPANYRYIDECGASGWYGEETLDVEAVHAMAPMANILYVGAASCDDGDLAAAVNTVVDNQLAQVITNSYGETEADAAQNMAGVRERHQTYLQAAAEGISIMFSSGDNGDEVAASGVRQSDMDASDPFVTAVGGTALAVTRDNGYGFEQGWGTGKSTLVDGAWQPLPPAYLYGGGGGTSQLFRQPWYQKGVVPWSIANYFHNGAHRAVPDVAMVGDPSTGFLVGQSQTFPNGSIRYSEYRIGGTSLSSPLFAGVVAVADQVNGGSLGFLNPKMYRLSGSSAFRDVNHGRRVTDGVVRVDYVNGINAADGTVTSLRTLNQTGTIFTRKGYDDVTGVGSPNGVSFLTAMAKGR